MRNYIAIIHEMKINKQALNTILLGGMLVAGGHLPSRLEYLSFLGVVFLASLVVYKPRSKKSWFCLGCYLNDYLPNKHNFEVDDFVSGIYSFITKRHIEHFYKPTKYSELSPEEAYKQISRDINKK